LYLKRLCFWALECVSRGPQGPKMYPKWLWVTTLIPHYQVHHSLLLIFL
jgi:hypothetical protein